MARRALASADEAIEAILEIALYCEAQRCVLSFISFAFSHSNKNTSTAVNKPRSRHSPRAASWCVQRKRVLIPSSSSHFQLQGGWAGRGRPGKIQPPRARTAPNENSHTIPRISREQHQYVSPFFLLIYRSAKCMVCMIFLTPNRCSVGGLHHSDAWGTRGVDFGAAGFCARCASRDRRVPLPSRPLHPAPSASCCLESGAGAGD